MNGHGNGILHVDKIADLLPVLIVGAVASEEADFPSLQDLLVGLGDEASHLPLVGLVGAVDVEVLDAGDPILTLEPSIAPGMEVEEVLGVPVGIERAKCLEMVGPVVHAAGPVAVGGGRTGVDEADAAREGPLGEGLGVAEVVLHQVAGVGLRRGRAGSEMVDGADGIEAPRIAFQPVEEGIGLLVVGEAEGGEIPPLGIPAEDVGDEDVLPAAEVQGVDEGAADQSGSAGDEDGG